MSDPRPGANGGLESSQGDRLDSWKEIAAYLKRDVTTVRGWEKKEALPVHRKVHDKLGSVYAFRAELDAWWQEGRREISNEPAPIWDTRRVAFAMVLLAAIIGAGAWSWLKPLSIVGAPRMIPLTAMEGSERYPRFSPDGSQIAFVANPQGPFVYVRQVKGGEALQVTRERGSPPYSLCWSPDGTRLAFIRDSADGSGAFVVPALGGLEKRVATVQTGTAGVSWADDHSLIIVDRKSRLEPNQLFRISIESQERSAITAPTRGYGDQQPNVSPDGKFVAFVRRSDNAGDLYLMPMGGGEPRPLTQ